MAAGVKDPIEITHFDIRQGGGVRQYLLCFRVVLETTGGVGLATFVIAAGINRGLPAFGRSQRDLRARVFKDIVGGCKFFQPEPGLLARVAQLVV